ncbi:hypothetical protein NQZ79_g2500 [Umbelopsis isabellina]|nr:hypothetical protein NQZ79_g2500 [Umbelopsis isabellina]
MESDSKGPPSCIVAIIPLAFIIVWALGIAKYDHNGVIDHAMQFAIAELVLNGVLFAVSLFSCLGIAKLLLAMIGVAYFIVNVVFFGLGFGWFKQLTGYTIFEMYQQLSPNAWLELPLIQAIMYFNLWLTLVGMCLVVFVIVIALLVALCSLCSVWVGELRFKSETPNV